MTIPKLTQSWNRDDHPNIIIGIRAIYKSNVYSYCPRCLVSSSRVIDWLSSLLWDCIYCGNTWKYNKKRIRRDQMSIIIEVKRHQESEGAVPTIEVTKIDCMTYNQLPKRYLKQPKNIFLNKYRVSKSKKTVKINSCVELRGNSTISKVILEVGEKYDLKDFQKRIRFIRKCGKKLKKIRAILKKEKETKWPQTKKGTYKI